MYESWGDPCDVLVLEYGICGSYCGACAADWMVADADPATCNAWSIHMRLDGWHNATVRIEDDHGTLLIDGLAYSDDWHVSAGIAEVC
eukprot:COSAG04_NODE_20478_length_392_cov_1.566553_1_plen_87_part_10